MQWCASWRVAGKDGWVDLPWLTCPHSPNCMVVDFATGVWMEQDVEVISILSRPGGSSFIVLLWNKPGVLSGEEWTFWNPVDWEGAYFQLLWSWITGGESAVFFSIEVEVINEFSLELHRFSNLNRISL